MSIPRKITIEILTTDDSNVDPILLLLRACQWLQMSLVNMSIETSTTTLTMQASQRFPNVQPIKLCSICGGFKPTRATTVCFGCVANDVRQANVNTPREP